MAQPALLTHKSHTEPTRLVRVRNQIRCHSAGIGRLPTYKLYPGSSARPGLLEMVMNNLEIGSFVRTLPDGPDFTNRYATIQQRLPDASIGLGTHLFVIRWTNSEFQKTYVFPAPLPGRRSSPQSGAALVTRVSRTQLRLRTPNDIEQVIEAHYAPVS